MGDFSWATAQIIVVCVFDHRQTADTGAVIHADTLGVLFSYFDTGSERFIPATMPK
jgi:hypothetical protein